MEYLQYVPPHIVAERAREVLAKSTETREEHWQRLIRSGLIKILDDGSVQVCYSRESDPDEQAKDK